MSPIGRIFLVLNLILSAAFLGWAANALAQTDNFKADLDAKTQELADAQDAHATELAGLRTEIDQSENARRTHREERDAMTAERDRLQSQLMTVQGEKDQLLGDVQKIQATLGDYQGLIDRLSSEKDQAVEARHEAEGQQATAEQARDAAVAAQRDAEDAQRELERQIASLEEAVNTITGERDSLDTRLAVLSERTGVTLDEILVQEAVDGQVISVDNELGLVMLNVGTDDGVKKGYKFDLYSLTNSQYKGQARVLRVFADKCSALVDTPVAGTSIQQGDAASTRM